METSYPASKDPPPPGPQPQVNAPSHLQAHLAMASENRRNLSNQPQSPHPGAFPIHTPKPIDGFPKTHMRHSAQLFDDLDYASATQWDMAVPEPKLLVQIFDLNLNKATLETVQTATHNIRRVITGIAYELQDASAAKIAPPSRAPDASAAPVTFLLYGISHALQTILMNTKVWATPEVSFEVFRFAPEFPTFLFALTGFVDAASPEAYSIILKTWNTDKMYDEYTGIITKDPEFPTEASLEHQSQWLVNTFHKLLDSLQVVVLELKLSGNIPAPRFHIFAQIPTDHPKTWHDLRNLLEMSPYIDPLHGMAARAALRPCSLCHCISHPRGLCPFPEIDGWLGPPLSMSLPPAVSNETPPQQQICLPQIIPATSDVALIPIQVHTVHNTPFPNNQYPILTHPRTPQIPTQSELPESHNTYHIYFGECIMFYPTTTL